ncbi:holin [Pseudomonas sp. So3.2b]|nr:holin [Pseudomonas sp. So3.2b]
MANPTPEGIVEVVGASIANKGMAVGAVTGAVGWLSQVNWIGIAGVVVAVVGLLVSTYFQIRRDRREAAESAARTAESAARVKALQGKCEI